MSVPVASGVPDLLRRLVDRVPSMLAYWDRDLRCRFANQAYERWFGVNPQALNGTSIRDLLGPELFALNEPHIRRALAGEEQQFERIVPGADGVRRHSLAHYLPDVVDGEVVGFVVQVTEVTNLKVEQLSLRDEAAGHRHTIELLRKRESALRCAQRLGQIGSWEWEVATDITTWSEQMYRMFGRDPRRLSPFYAEHGQLYMPESWKRLQEGVRRTQSTGKPFLLELEYVHVDGSTGWLEMRGEAERDAIGMIVALHGTAQDISGRRHAQRARQDRELLRAQVDFDDPLADARGSGGAGAGFNARRWSREHRHRVLRAVEDAGVGVWLWDSATGQVLWENDQPYRIFGMDPEEPALDIETLASGFLHPDDVEAFRAAVLRTTEEFVHFHFEGRILRRPDRQVGWVRFQGRRQRPPAPALVLGTIIDITEHKRSA